MTDRTARPDETPEERRERLLKAARSLGPLLPESTRDDTDDGWSERSRGSRDDDIARDVPPHH